MSTFTEEQVEEMIQEAIAKTEKSFSGTFCRLKKENEERKSERENTMSDNVVDYWIKHYCPAGLCTLCGQYGIIHTEGIRSPAGVEVGRKNFCICPNGQELRKTGSVNNIR